ncbi:phospholipid scramblase 1 [Halyomorpha halys]|uniref:phospholipid scramblase 1 n=1 Tax=Halyomorpha halys TaxID=286706 RepID=UPI0006D4D68B|nr:phospholipid scramblase family member 5-like [Halyomorpha halys]
MTSLTSAFREANLERDSIFNFNGADDDIQIYSNQTVITNQPFPTDQTSSRIPLPIISGRHQHILPFCGIQLLSDVGQLEIQQTIDFEDLYTLIDSENKYLIKAENGEVLFGTREGSSSWQRLLCCSSRRFILSVFDKAKQEALYCIRRLAPTCPLFSCYLQRMDVFIPQCEYIGCIQQKWNPIKIKLVIRNFENQDIFYVDGPLCTTFAAMKELDFYVFSYDLPQSVCSISHKWNEYKATYSLFLTFHGYLSNTHKALLLACAFLLEYIYFQAEIPIKCSC